MLVQIPGAYFFRNTGRGAEAQGVAGALQGQEVSTTILVDGRTNSLLVMAMPEEMPRIKDLVARLDVEVIEPERNFHIYNLENVKADEIADRMNSWSLRERVFTMQYASHQRFVDWTGRTVALTLDNDDLRALVGTMGRFPAFRETGWRLLKTARVVRNG